MCQAHTIDCNNIKQTERTVSEREIERQRESAHFYWPNWFIYRFAPFLSFIELNLSLNAHSPLEEVVD